MVSKLARGYELLRFSYSTGGQSGRFGVNGILLVCMLGMGMLGGLPLYVMFWI